MPELCRRSIPSDELLVKMIEEVKTTNSKEHQQVQERIAAVEKTVDDLLKFRWQAAAVVGAAVLLVGLIVPFVDNLLPPHYTGDNPPTRLR